MSAKIINLYDWKREKALRQVEAVKAAMRRKIDQAIKDGFIVGPMPDLRVEGCGIVVTVPVSAPEVVITGTVEV